MIKLYSQKKRESESKVMYSNLKNSRFLLIVPIVESELTHRLILVSVTSYTY